MSHDEIRERKAEADAEVSGMTQSTVFRAMRALNRSQRDIPFLLEENAKQRAALDAVLAITGCPEDSSDVVLMADAVERAITEALA